MRLAYCVFITLLFVTRSGSSQTFEEYLQKARDLYAQQNFASAAHYYDLAFTQEDATAELYYEAATAWSRSGDVENGIWTLKKAVSVGLHDWRRLQADEAFIPLHKHASWLWIVERARSNEEEYQRNAVQPEGN